MGKLEDIFIAAFWDDDLRQISNWIEWKHISRGLTHCPVCLSLDKCWFVDRTNQPCRSMNIVIVLRSRFHLQNRRLPHLRIVQLINLQNIYSPINMLGMVKGHYLNLSVLQLKMRNGLKKNLKKKR